MVHPVVARDDLACVGDLQDPGLEALHCRIGVLPTRDGVAYLAALLQIFSLRLLRRVRKHESTLLELPMVRPVTAQRNGQPGHRRLWCKPGRQSLWRGCRTSRLPLRGRVHRPAANGLAFQRHVGIVYPAEYDDVYHCY